MGYQPRVLIESQALHDGSRLDGLCSRAGGLTLTGGWAVPTVQTGATVIRLGTWVEKLPVADR